MYADTGVLYAATSSPEVLEAFSQRYTGRLSAVVAVIDEVNLHANQDPANSPVVACARLVKSQLLRPGRIIVDDCADMGAAVFDSVLAQLNAMPGTGSTHHPNKNLGEATLIALCVARQKLGQRTVLLSNDRDARTVSQLRGIPCVNFRHVLRELVCAGLVDSDAAFRVFKVSQDISGISHAQLTNSLDDFVCRATDGACKSCSLYL